MKPPNDSTGPSGRDVAPPEAASSLPGSRDLLFPVFNRLRHEQQEKSDWKVIPDAELLNDSGMKKGQD